MVPIVSSYDCNTEDTSITCPTFTLSNALVEAMVLRTIFILHCAIARRRGKKMRLSTMLTRRHQVLEIPRYFLRPHSRRRSKLFRCFGGETDLQARSIDPGKKLRRDPVAFPAKCFPRSELRECDALLRHDNK